MFKRNSMLLAVAVAAAGVLATAQPRGPVPETGHVGLGVILRQLGNVGIFMQATAHPDDESNALLTMLDRGQGYRTTLLTATRGTGGQNEIGPELFEALSVLRTAELESVHRFDGAEQFFARAVDFGYSFSVDETYEKWGREEILSDYVRLIRMVRPDVIVTMRPDGQGGGEHHQAQARITGDAFRMAADPTKFPGQIEEGLRPWQPKKLYYTASYGFRGEPPPPPDAKVLAVATDVYDPLLGATYSEVGAEARSYHKCQGMGQLLALPGPQVARYRLGETVLPGGTGRDEATLFDGVDTTVQGLAQYVNGVVPPALSTGLAAIAAAADAGRQAFASGGMDAAARPLANGLLATRALRGRLAALGMDAAAVYEIDYRLASEEAEFQDALLAAQAIRIDVLANDGLVVRGQPLGVQAIVANRGRSPVEVKRVWLMGLDHVAPPCEVQVLEPGGVYRCEVSASVPATAETTTPYWEPIPGSARYEFDDDAPFGLPFEPTPFRARIQLSIAGADVNAELPVKARYEGNIFSGEKRTELMVIPRYSVRVTPEIAVIPQDAIAAGRRDGPSSRELRVAVTNGYRGAGNAVVRVVAPGGWKVSPEMAQVTFAREDEESTVRFTVTPPSGLAAGEYRVRAVAQAEAGTFAEGYEVIEYPHINRRHRVIPSETTIKAIDVDVPAGLRVGYVMGVGDQVPSAIRQLGAQLEMLAPDDLAWGDLSRYDTIMTGVRAYERRPDLRANNDRLLRYVEGGGTLIVQYNKFEFNEAQYGPYPAKVSSNRVTGEEAPVTLLVPDHPVFSVPNRIDEDTWKGWVQERGLYFLGADKDPRYVDLVSLEDPFPHNPGVKTGALVEARVGKGRWIYLGLGLWRQLPAGTEGAYELLANLISLR